MKCFNHDDDAVAQCNDCGKGLCRECAEKYQAFNMVLCDKCASVRNNNDKGAFTKTIIMAVVALGIGIFIGVSSEMEMGSLILFSILTACVPFGWRVLNKITPNIFLFLPIIGWVIYFALKLVLSYLIGIVAMPIYIIRAVKGLSDSSKVDNYIKG